MDKLSQKQQQEVSKTSTERLRMKLAKADYDEETVATADRNMLLNMYADYLLAPTVEPKAEVETVAEELALRRQELELRMLEMEERKEERKRSELKEEEDRRLREKELMLKEQEIERQRLKDREEKSRRESLTGLTKHYGKALKHVLPRMGHEPSD